METLPKTTRNVNFLKERLYNACRVLQTRKILSLTETSLIVEELKAQLSWQGKSAADLLIAFCSNFSSSREAANI